VAIDPYYKLIDRDRDDNIRVVMAAGARAGAALPVSVTSPRRTGEDTPR
jgi:hypothetical protein